mgnify:FL=1
MKTTHSKQKLTELFGFSQAEKLAAKGAAYLKADVDSYYEQWILGIQQGKFTPDAQGFANFKNYVIKERPPIGIKLTTKDPVSFDNKSIYAWTTAAIKEKNYLATQQPAKTTKQPAFTLDQILLAIRKLNANDVKEVMHELQALGYRLNDQTQNKKPKSPKNP